MTNLSSLANSTRLLFTVPLKPVQGDRFQPTGFPGLGAATYQTKDGDKVLVESAQSMANRLESVCWDESTNAPIATLKGISHITVQRKGAFLTDSMLESHRINSPYILEGEDKSFFNTLKKELNCVDEVGIINRTLLTKTLLKYDIGSLIHGVFLAKKELNGGRLRVARALSAFIEASGTRIAASGGVKNDHLHPGKVDGDSKNHFGNIPFSRDEFTADTIACHINLDLAQLRGYGLGDDATNLLTLLSLYKIRKLFDGDLRLRTACDLIPEDDIIIADRPSGFTLPSAASLESVLPAAIQACANAMTEHCVIFNDKLKKAKESED